MSRRPQIHFRVICDAVYVTAPRGSWVHQEYSRIDSAHCVLVFCAEEDGRVRWWDARLPKNTFLMTESLRDYGIEVKFSGARDDTEALMELVKAEFRRGYDMGRRRPADAADKDDRYVDLDEDSETPPVTPALYDGEEEYIEIQAINSTSLKKIHSSSPLHYWHQYRNPNAPPFVATQSMQVGTALHGLVLQGEQLWRVRPDISQQSNLGKALHARVLLGPDSYYVAPVEARRTKAQKETYNEWIRDVPDRSIIINQIDAEKLEEIYYALPEDERLEGLPLTSPILSHAEVELVIGMADALRAHDGASQLIEATIATERVLRWNYLLRDQEPVPCKAMLDGLIYEKPSGRSQIIDLKTTLDASQDGFAREIAKYHYHIQGAFYMDGLYANFFPLGVEIEDIEFVLIAVESKPPHAVGVYKLGSSAINQGRREYTRALQQYWRCMEAEKAMLAEGRSPDLAWPGYPRVPELTLPRWAQDEDAYNELSK